MSMFSRVGGGCKYATNRDLAIQTINVRDPNNKVLGSGFFTELSLFKSHAQGKGAFFL